MLTRLKVKGFKNLVDVDVRFGPFTCIAGVNGAGKSNLFDAILFLSALADRTLLEAATGVREETRSADAARIFSRAASWRAHEIRLEAEMIVPQHARDDLDQPAEASITALRYAVTIRARPEAGSVIPRLEVAEERLDYIKKGELIESLPFARDKKAWRESIFKGRRTSPLISTETSGEGRVVKVHEDSGHQGRGRTLRAEGLARTVLSTINTAESPTALVARREMQSWRLLQLEPSRLRAPDDMKAAPTIGRDGTGVPATLHRLLAAAGGDELAVRARLANRLSELLDDIRDVRIDADEKRELLTLVVKARDGSEFRARDLSDGTLRFLALAILQADTAWGGLLCMEEPENGIHPQRIPPMLELLQELVVRLDVPVDDANPLRQVIVNTHSPEVAGLVPEHSLLFAQGEERIVDGHKVRNVSFRPLDETWRAQAEPRPRTVDKGTVLEFLNALPAALRTREEQGLNDDASANYLSRRPVAARLEISDSLFLPFPSPGEAKT